nr:MAG TPA: hypothetical protein [Caudoviricetes sp.]
MTAHTANAQPNCAKQPATTGGPATSAANQST